MPTIELMADIAILKDRVACLEEALEAIKEGRVLVMDAIGETFAEALQEVARVALENTTNHKEEE